MDINIESYIEKELESEKDAIRDTEEFIRYVK